MSRNYRILSVLVGFVVLIFAGIWGWWRYNPREYVCDSYYDAFNNKIDCGLRGEFLSGNGFRVVGMVMGYSLNSQEVRLGLRDIGGRKVEARLRMGLEENGKRKVGVLKFNNNNASEGQVGAQYDEIDPSDVKQRLEGVEDLVIHIRVGEAADECSAESGNSLLDYLKSGKFVDYFSYKIKEMRCSPTVSQLSYY